jgi:5-methylcytosine-specific restriction endonuclease McrA
MNQLVWSKERKAWTFVPHEPRTRALSPKQRTRFRAALLEMHGPNCWLCNKRIRNETPTLDHVVPRALGGRNVLENLRLAHERCNMKRGSAKVPELLLTRAMRLDRPQGWGSTSR